MDKQVGLVGDISLETWLHSTFSRPENSHQKLSFKTRSAKDYLKSGSI